MRSCVQERLAFPAGKKTCRGKSQAPRSSDSRVAGTQDSVFLGYAEADPKQKLLETRCFDPVQNWWTAELSDNELMQMTMIRSTRAVSLENHALSSHRYSLC